jgi:uncharacterized protein DUF6221
MNSLASFLAARLDEDEAAARACGYDGTLDWSAAPEGHHEGRVTDDGGSVVVYDEGSPTFLQAQHIARHDPARVLREVAAGRAILARYGEPLAGLGLGEQLQLSQEKQGLYFAVCALAAVYSGHPDYRQGWKQPR